MNDRSGTQVSFVAVSRALELDRNTHKYHGYLSVYALCGPDTRVRYVGITRKTLPERLRRHYEQPTNRAMSTWLGEMYLDGVEPRMVLLEYVSKHEWEDAERGWIAWFRARGDLLNVD